ncbi:serine/threonine-protein kinase [Artemisia annua]|uniref:Serine/threonine-protein kinase n=1 Tax=Artemisia annua TaxID=35608 RepID=A0A2U1NT14_ARTAN|nr:serine/threonine-protein kinase [Artemisia annua]
MLLIIDPRLEDQYSMRMAQKSSCLVYYYLRHNPKVRPLMIDIVETFEPLQCNRTGNAPITFISPLTGCGSTTHSIRWVVVMFGRLAYYYLRYNPKAGPLMIDIVKTLEPLQRHSTGNAPITFISSLTGCGSINGGYTEYQMGRRVVLRDPPHVRLNSQGQNESVGHETVVTHIMVVAVVRSESGITFL